MFAAMGGHTETAYLLIKCGASLNERSNAGCNAAMFAAMYGHLATLQFLYSRGAEIQESDNNGMTCLMCASKNGHLNVVKFLIENGANIEDVDIVFFNIQHVYFLIMDILHFYMQQAMDALMLSAFFTHEALTFSALTIRTTQHSSSPLLMGMLRLLDSSMTGAQA